jgi:hypothetical protein
MQEFEGGGYGNYVRLNEVNRTVRGANTRRVSAEQGT